MDDTLTRELLRLAREARKAAKEEMKYLAFKPLILNPETLGFCPEESPDFSWPVWNIVEPSPCPLCHGTMDNCLCGIHMTINLERALSYVGQPRTVLTVMQVLGRTCFDDKGNLRAARAFLYGIVHDIEIEPQRPAELFADAWFGHAMSIKGTPDDIRKLHSHIGHEWRRTPAWETVANNFPDQEE